MSACFAFELIFVYPHILFFGSLVKITFLIQVVNLDYYQTPILSQKLGENRHDVTESIDKKRNVYVFDVLIY